MEAAIPPTITVAVPIAGIKKLFLDLLSGIVKVSYFLQIVLEVSKNVIVEFSESLIHLLLTFR